MFLSTLVVCLVANADDRSEATNVKTYLQFRTRPGDSVGSILSHLAQCPVWGKTGSAARTLAINPSLRMAHPDVHITLLEAVKRGDWLEPNVLINLPIQSIPSRIRTHARINAEGLIEMIPEAPVISCHSDLALSRRTEKVSPKETEAPEQAMPLLSREETAPSKQEPQPTPTPLAIVVPVDPPNVVAPVVQAPASQKQNPEPALLQLEAPLPPPLGFYLQAGLDIHYFLVNEANSTTGNNLSILSQPSLRLNLESGLWLNHSDSIFLRLWGERFSLASLDETQSFSSSSGFLTGFGLFYSHQFSSHWSVAAGSSFDQDLFFDTSSSSTVLQYNSILIAKPGLESRFIFNLVQGFYMGLDADVALALPVGSPVYSISTGQHEGGNLFLQFRPESSLQEMAKAKSVFEAKLGFSYDSQNTSVASRSAKDISLGFSYRRFVPW